MKIQAIETRYKGHRFRSRLEARWAVFFDALPVMWHYELEGFDLGGVRYLPDFWLPQVHLWGEVKPDKFSPQEREKCNRLVEGTGHGCLMLVGPPDVKTYEVIHKGCGSVYVTDLVMSNYHSYPKDEGRFYYTPSEYELEDMRDTIDAVNAARAARFEYGECG